MTSRKLLGASVFLFMLAALVYCAGIALGGNERVGHFDLIEYINGAYKTTVRAGSLSGDTTFTLPTSTGSSTQLLHGGATQTWSAASLTADVSGMLPVANGGTGASTLSGAFDAISPMTTLGDTIYGAASGSGTRLGGNTTSTKNFLTQTGTGSVSAAPAWGTIAAGDVPNLDAAKITTGTLAVARGGTNLASGTSGGVLAYTASGTLASSGALTANAVVVGGGAGVVPSVVTNNGTATNEFLTQSSSGAPAWAALLAADIPNLSASKITSGQIAIANGGTGAATQAAGFNALSPMSAAGDVIYGGVSGAGTRLAAGSSTQLFHGGTTPSWAAASLTADVTGTLPVANGGTGITSFGTGVATWFGTPSSANLAAATTDETGSGALVFGTAPTITLANGTGLPISTGVSGLGSGVATFLATPSSANLATAVTDETGSGALVFGTAPTITLANGTGLPISTGVSGLGTGVATFLATPSSANLASAVTDETGSGALCFATAPSFTTDIALLAAAESRYYNAGGTHYVGFKGGNASADKIWTLPLADGSANQVLSTDGSGTLSWASGLSSSLNQYNLNIGDSTNTAVSTNTNILGDVRASSASQAYTVTNATPGVFTITGHGFSTGDKVYVTATQNGFTANTTYYVHVVNSSTFNLATTQGIAIGGGPYIQSTGTTAGTMVSGGLKMTNGQPFSMVTCDSPNGYGSTNTAIRRYTNCTTLGSDITYADSATAGASFTINAPGVYAISRWDGGAVAGGQEGISLNSNQLTTNIASITTANRIAYDQTQVVNDITAVATTYQFNLNDVIRPHDSVGVFTNNGASNQIIITEVYKY